MSALTSTPEMPLHVDLGNGRYLNRMPGPNGDILEIETEAFPADLEWSPLPATRKEAIAQGAERYFDGGCRYGHVVPRKTSTGKCVVCYVLGRERRADAKEHATPAWADLEVIRHFYINCPNGYDVDHIIPLQHDLVCGFHVIENLRYLPRSANRRKTNKFVPFSEDFPFTK